MTAERVLPLSGVHNFRDYGGYAVEGGGRLRDGMLWRSAHHEAATDEDLAALDALGLETIIDLRGDDERELHPCRRSENFSARVLFAVPEHDYTFSRSLAAPMCLAQALAVTLAARGWSIRTNV